MKLGKLIKLFIGIPLLLVAISYGYLWYSTKKTADQLISNLSLFAEAEYDSITVSPFGRASINGLSITPHGTYDHIIIDALSLEADSIFDLINLDRDLNRKQPPERLTMTVSGVDLPLYSNFMSVLNPTANTPQQLDALACGDIRAFGPKQWQAMGYESLKFDLQLGYDYNKHEELVKISLLINTINVGEITFYTDLPINDLQQAALTRAPDFGIQRINFEWTDRGMYARRAQYCAAQTGLNVDDYYDAHLQALSEILHQRGLALAEQTLTAYRRVIADKASVNLGLRPPPGTVNWRQDFTLEQFLEQLNPVLRVDDEIVDIAWSRVRPAAQRTDVAANADTATDLERSKPNQLMRQKRKRAKLHFDPASLNDADDHIGRLSHITLNDGRSYRGQIEQVKNGTIAIKTNLHGGSVTYHVNLVDVRDYRLGVRRPMN